MVKLLTIGDIVLLPATAREDGGPDITFGEVIAAISRRCAQLKEQTQIIVEELALTSEGEVYKASKSLPQILTEIGKNLTIIKTALPKPRINEAAAQAVCDVCNSGFRKAYRAYELVRGHVRNEVFDAALAQEEREAKFLRQSKRALFPMIG